MTDIVEENRGKLAELLTGRENWRPEVAGEDGEPGWCFGAGGAGRLTVFPEMDGFLMVVHGQERSDGPRQSWIIPRIESVGEWLDEHEQEYAGLTSLQVEFKEAVERARRLRGMPGRRIRSVRLRRGGLRGSLSAGRCVYQRADLERGCQAEDDGQGDEPEP